MLFLLGAETQLVNMVNDLAEIVAALDAILELGEYLADLVFDRVGTLRRGFEFL